MSGVRTIVNKTESCKYVFVKFPSTTFPARFFSGRRIVSVIQRGRFYLVAGKSVLLKVSTVLY